MEHVVIGGTGRIGSKLVRSLRSRGHGVRAALPSTGVDIVTGQGLEDALGGVDVVIDVSDPATTDAASALAHFERSGRRLLAAEHAAGVSHHVALSVVGVDRLPTSAYFRAKLAQEFVIRAATIPFTIVRELAEVVSSGPRDDVVEIAGPERMRFADWIRRLLAAADDGRAVTSHAEARSFDTELHELSLVPTAMHRVGATRLDAWLRGALART